MNSEAYTGQIARWCDRHGLLLTGHMVYEENSYSVWYHGDSFAHLRHMHYPGCDLLRINTSYATVHGWYEFGQASLIKTAKVPPATARYGGRKRVMCEAYGVAPWTKTMADEKRITDWLVALGVNLINDNSLISHITGFRKRAISGKHFTQPWWPDARLYYDYAARISALCAETTLDADTAVLYPTTTWWSMVRRTRETSPELRRLELALDHTLDALLRTHRDFELIFEPVLEGAQVEDGTLTTGNASFSTIVAAGVTRLPPGAARKLEEFAASGGRVILAGSDIRVMEEGGNRAIHLPGAVKLPEPSAPEFRERLDADLSKTVPRPWGVSGNEAHDVIAASRVSRDGRKLLFLANMTPTDKSLTVSWPGDRAVELWDAATGARWTPEQEGGRIEVLLPVEESLWVVQADGEGSAGHTVPAPFARTPETPALEIDGPWSFSTDRPNLWKLQARLLPDAEGVLTPSSSELSAPDGWIELEEDDAKTPLGPEAMKCYWLRADFELRAPIPDLRLVVDSDDVQSAYLNDVPLGEPEPVSVWDDGNLAFSLGSAAGTGANSLLVKVAASPYNSERIAVFPTSIVEPLVLQGTFAVGANGELRAPVREVRTGDLRAQGMPHFVGSALYETTLDWNGPEGPVLFRCDTGRDLSEVFLDGVSLGARAWGPRAFRVERLTRGRHTLKVRTANTLGSILRRFYGAEVNAGVPPSGLLSPVRVYPV